MVRLLQPHETNLRKRLVKAPKVYLREPGILHALLDVESYDQLLAHPANGVSLEGYAVEQIIAALPRHRPSFLRTSNGSEIDLVMERGRTLEVFELKLSKSPKPSRGFQQLVADLQPARSWVIAPVDETYYYSKGVTVAHPRHLFR
jgi:predicted AAA+ superfamily ATPase